jgi:hypothetical protein
MPNKKIFLTGMIGFGIFLTLLAGYFGALGGCGNGTGTGGGGGGGTGSQPTLTSNDFPSVSPCSDRDTLPSDATFLDTITSADGVLHIHRRYDGDATLPALCGLDGSWDPSDISEAAGTEQRSFNTFEANLSSFIQSRILFGSNMTEVCRNGYGFEAGADTAIGLPQSGTFRGEGCVESGGNAYRFRVRVTVTGSGTDKTFAELGITDESELALFDADGNEIETQAQAEAVVTASPESFTVTLRSQDGTTTYLSVTVEIICVKKLTTACPSEN